MMNNGYTPRGEFYQPTGTGGGTATMCFDNKAMVASVPTAVNAPPPPTVRLNITEPEKTSPKQKTPSRMRFRKRIRLHYAINALLCIIVLSLIVLLELGYIPATKTGFYCQDPSLSYKYTGDTISGTSLLVTSLLVVPFAVLFLTEYLRKSAATRICLREGWYFYKEFLIGCGLALLITEVGKALAGEHRPHFFDTCQPDSAANCTAGEYVAQYKCTTGSSYSVYFVADTSRSFPSGHATMSTFVAVFCSYVIQTRLPTVRTGHLIRPFLIAVLTTWALTYSLTRITDKRHHWWDVGVGMLLGAATSAYTIGIVRRRQLQLNCVPRVAVSTTTLIDVKNKDAKSEII